MKHRTRRILAGCLVAAGILLIALAVVLAWVETAEKDVIGGADWPTFQMILRRGQGGLYGYTVLGGMALLVAGIVAGLVKKRRGGGQNTSEK